MSKLNTGFASALALTTALALSGCATTTASDTVSISRADVAQITQAEVLAAQNAWGDALVRIATEYDTKGADAAKKTAETVLDTAYGYAWGPVLFKPTLTTEPQTFRTTRDGALAYFVGGSASYPKDTGFALKGWRSYKITNAAVFIDDDIAITMGKVALTDKNGGVTVVDKTWGFKRDDKGALRIVLHHSSLPYTP